ncbi:UbiA family prenyltransferase [Nocardioides ferulae]|uniref:UbiA family prenyltransferase n=1 Tax=Nocardioides ferulae TaxID=2340821 RepID=UPI000EAD3D7C|nr:UbiA family prenyltransferase [Nocardioides ferulae]
MAKTPWRRRSRSAPDTATPTPATPAGPATGTRATAATVTAAPRADGATPGPADAGAETKAETKPGTATGVATASPTAETAPPPGADAPSPAGHRATEPVRRRRILDATPLLLLRSAHPRQAVLIAIGLAVAAALANRPTREVGLVFVTVLVGQAVLGWHNDLVDRRRDAEYDVPGKPLADGRLDPGTAWFALACGVLLVVPLAVTNGLVAGAAYLLSVLVGLLGNVVLRRGVLSFLPWAVAFALYPAFLSYGGWGGASEGDPPHALMTGLAALLGVGVHLLTALWGLVADNKEGWTYLPLRLGLRLGASRLLTVALAYLGLVLVAMAFAGTYVGLAR